MIANCALAASTRPHRSTSERNHVSFVHRLPSTCCHVAQNPSFATKERRALYSPEKRPARRQQHRRVSKWRNSRAARPAGRPGAASTRSRRRIWYCSRGPTRTAAHRRRPSQISSVVEPRNTGVRRSFIKRSSSRRKGHRASSWLGRSRSIECLQLRRHGKLRRQSSRSRRPSCCHRLRRMSCCSSER